ncbi:MAG TPA: hypothetical protein VFH91_07425 [Pyrinomonadaceae bacterium]|nr:hypothetical protein [Pyrinomonadaceae bacterium]
MTSPRHRVSFLVVVLTLMVSPVRIFAQETGAQSKDNDLSQILRLERIEIPNGAELITIHAKLDGLDQTTADKWVPLVSILRDNLGDNSYENDRLRYVWPLTYTRPSFKQRLAAAVPFFYSRVGNKEHVSSKPPPPAMDLAAPESQVWDKIFWTALQNILLDPYGTPIKASTSTYRRNINDYRRAHIVRALSVLTLYQAVKGESAFSDSEMAEMQARLLLTDKTFGGLVDDSNLQRYYTKKVAEVRDERGHNWELLRQRAEAESLFFEPLLMPDGSPTHAILWVAKSDLEKRQGASYSGRFLNIANPWTDKRLLQWQGFVETRYFNAEHMPVDQDTPGAKAVEMIPLGLYGLDNPKIPMLLVDFRDSYNPKKREMSRRVLNDVTRNILSVSKFGNLPYFLGRTVFDFVTGRRGIDVNQPSRLQTYSQLKLLLALNNSMDPDLRQEVNGRLEHVSLNPFENDLEAEAKLARGQYAALIAFARDPEGLVARVDRDRRAEMTALDHGRKAQVAFNVLHVLSFGRYIHREEASPELEARLDISRRLDFHSRFLAQIAKSSVDIDVSWNLNDVRRSLAFISEHGTEAGSTAVMAAAKIFSRTNDTETRRACLDSLSRISNPKARDQLLRISQNTSLDQSWRDLASQYLAKVNEPLQPIVTTASDLSHKSGQPR